MTSQGVTRNDAAEEFVQLIKQTVYDNAIKSVSKRLDESRNQSSLPSDAWPVQELIELAVRVTLHELFILFDGITGTFRDSSGPFDYAIYRQSYIDDEALWSECTSSRIRINPPDPHGDELHVLLEHALSCQG